MALPLAGVEAVLSRDELQVASEEANHFEEETARREENGGCLHYLYNHTTGGSQLTDGALRPLLSRLDSAKRSLVDADGFPVFISTIQVPSKVFSCGVVAKKFKCKTEQRDIFLHIIEIHPVFDFWVSLCFWWFRRARVCAN